MGETKLQLDEAVGGQNAEVDANGELDDREVTKASKKNLLGRLRQQLQPGLIDNGSASEPERVMPPFLQKINDAIVFPDPQVTLTFAQSSDCKIAGRGRAQVAISGPQSMEMTHWCVGLMQGRSSCLMIMLFLS